MFCQPCRVLHVQARPNLTLATNCQILFQSCDAQYELCELLPCSRLSLWQYPGKSVCESLNTSWRQVLELIGISLHQSYRIPRPLRSRTTTKWLPHLLIMGSLLCSLFVRIVRHQPHHCGEGMRWVRCCAMPAAYFSNSTGDRGPSASRPT